MSYLFSSIVQFDPKSTDLLQTAFLVGQQADGPIPLDQQKWPLDPQDSSLMQTIFVPSSFRRGVPPKGHSELLDDLKS